MAGFISIAVKVTDTHERVVKAWERKAVRCLFGAAGYANRTMKSRMRKRKAVSDVGDYPSSHAGQLKDYVAFAVDERTKMAIIGPKLYPGSKDQSQRTKTIPQLINEGGTSIKRVKTQAGKRKTTVIEGRRVYQDNKGRIRKIGGARRLKKSQRSEEHTSELQSPL